MTTRRAEPWQHLKRSSQIIQLAHAPSFHNHSYPRSPVPAYRNANNPPARGIASPESPKQLSIDSRWLTLIKRRIGKCLAFGLKPIQIEDAGRLLQEIATDWRELIAGSEGFLTDQTRRALFRHDLVWGDMDVMVRSPCLRMGSWGSLTLLLANGHINNVAYLRYAESARVNLMHNYGLYIDPAHKGEWLALVGSTGIGLILQSIKLDYKFPMKWPDKITVYHKLVHDPSSSAYSHQSAFEQQVLILSEAYQRPAARCHEGNVIYDYRTQSKTPSIPGFIVDQFKETWRMQEEAKKLWGQRVLAIEGKVKWLEMASWDREDAVEDMGFSAEK